MPAPVDGAWQLLIELAGDTDQTERLADALEDAELTGEPAVGVDAAAQQRLWQVRESVAEVLGVYGPPLKFDVSLPLSAIPRVRRRLRRAGRRARPRRDPGAVRPHRRGQPAPEPGALRLDGERERACTRR